VGAASCGPQQPWQTLGPGDHRGQPPRWCLEDTGPAALSRYHREDAGTLVIAKHVVELAGLGERDAQRLAEATLARLAR
jgi:hypothetical protein